MAVVVEAATAAVAVAATVVVAPPGIEVGGVAEDARREAFLAVAQVTAGALHAVIRVAVAVSLAVVRVEVATFLVAIQIEAAAPQDIPEGSDLAVVRIVEQVEDMSGAVEVGPVTRLPDQLFVAAIIIPLGEAGVLVLLAGVISLPHAAGIPARRDDGMVHLAVILRLGQEDLHAGLHTMQSVESEAVHTVSDRWAGAGVAPGTAVADGTAG